MITPTKDLVNKHLGMMRIDLKREFTNNKRKILINEFKDYIGLAMSEQSNQAPGNPAGGNQNNNNPPRRNNNRRRHHNNNRPREAVDQPRNPNQQNTAPRPQGPNNNQNPNQRQGNPNQNPNQRRRPPQHNNNRPRPQGPPREQGGGGPFNIERIYEKYLNLTLNELRGERDAVKELGLI